MNIEKELSDNETILLITPSGKYNDLIADNAKKLASDNSVLYITLNKTYDSLKEIFEKKGVKTENMVFIDAISKTFKDTPDMTDQCYYCSSPNSFTEISLVISKVIKEGFDYLIFDSLTSLLVYEGKAPVSKFVSNIVNKMKHADVKGVFYALDINKHKSTIQEAGMFLDKVINLNKESGE